MNSRVASFIRRVRGMTLTNCRRRVRTSFQEDCTCMIRKEEAFVRNGTTNKITETGDNLGRPALKMVIQEVDFCESNFSREIKDREGEQRHQL